MARSPWLAPIAILLLICTFFTGCMANAPRDLSERSTIESARIDAQTPQGAQKAHCGHGGGAVALLFVYGIIFLGAVILDCLLLPATAPNDCAFCCTRSIVYIVK